MQLMCYYTEKQDKQQNQQQKKEFLIYMLRYLEA